MHIFKYRNRIILGMPSLRDKNIGKTIRVTNEAHKALIRLSTSKVETFSDVIMKLVDYYDKGHSK